MDKVDMDVSIFGYRYTQGEKDMIFSRSPVRIRLEPPVSPRPERARQSGQPSVLETLPLEVLHLILRCLDPRTLVSLRSTCRTILQIVAALPAFRELVEHAPQALAALSHTKLLRQYSVDQLHRALRSDRCAFCDAYGAYLYLLRCARCCYNCLDHNPRLISVPLTSVKKELAMSVSELKGITKLSCYLSPIEAYDFLERETDASKKRISLVNLEFAAEQKSRFKSSQLKEIAKRGKYRYSQYRFRQHASVALPYFDASNMEKRVHRGIWCRGCEDNWYYLAHRQRSSSCDEQNDAYDAQNVAFSSLEFIEHLKVCPGVKRLKGHGYPNFQNGSLEYRDCLERQ